MAVCERNPPSKAHTRSLSCPRRKSSSRAAGAYKMDKRWPTSALGPSHYGDSAKALGKGTSNTEAPFRCNPKRVSEVRSMSSIQFLPAFSRIDNYPL